MSQRDLRREPDALRAKAYLLLALTHLDQGDMHMVNPQLIKAQESLKKLSPESQEEVKET